MQSAVVVAERAVEGLARVADPRVRAESSHQRGAPRRGRGGTLRAEVLGDLNGEGADTAGARGDEDALTVPQPELVTDRLERGERGERNRGGRLELARGPHLCEMVLVHDALLGDSTHGVPVDPRVYVIADP